MDNNITGITFSAFDLLHAGHVEMLKECKQNCDTLIVGLNMDPIGKICAQSLEERQIQLEAIKYVDSVILYKTEEDLLVLLKATKPDVRFIGEDYIGKPFTGDDLDIEIFYNSRAHGWSTSLTKQQAAISISRDPLRRNGVEVKDNSVYRLVDDTTLNGLVVSTTELKASQCTTGHKHLGQEEVYYFIGGHGKLELGSGDDKIMVNVKGGEAYTIEDGIFHRVWNSSSADPLMFICVFNGIRSH